MEFVTLLSGIALPLVLLAALVVVVRHGPFRHRWWGGETPAGFALTVGGLALAAGFFGPILLAPEANQGPLLGLFITGPAGLVLGLAWGAWRAKRRRKAGNGTTAG
jgi:hypothetical protein